MISISILGEKMEKATFLSVTAIIISLVTATFITFNNQAQISLLKNEIKALEGELENKVLKEETPHKEVLQADLEIILKTNLSEGKFSFLGNNGVKNPEIHIKKGSTVKIVIVNGDGIEHDFTIPDLNIHAEHISKKGEETSVVFKADKEGIFTYYCSIPGHRELGMEGKIVVEG